MNEFYVQVWSQWLGWQQMLPPGSTYQQVAAALATSSAAGVRVYQKKVVAG